MVLPNAEALLSQFFRHDAMILATSLADNTYTELPKKYPGPYPVCRITRVGGATEDALALMDDPLLQVDVWGGPKTEAHKIAQTMRVRLARRLPYRGDAGCLMAVLRFGGLRYLPDETFDPAKPRYLFDVTIRTRP